MIVCVCHNVSDKRLMEAAESGAQSLAQAKIFTPLGGCCGKCVPHAKEAFSAALSAMRSRQRPAEEMASVEIARPRSAF